MAVLEKIRVKLGILISILIAVALLSFIIDPNTLGSTLQSMSKDNNVGEMNGKAVTYRDYFTAVEQNTQLMQALSGSGANSEEAQNQLRDMTWNEFFNERVFFPKVKAAGFSVEDAEMVSLLGGANPSPIVAQQRVFAGEDGRFSPEAVKNFVSQMDLDESGVSRLYWNYLKKQVYSQQMYNKYISALRAGTVLNASQIARAISDGNTTKDVDFFVVPINFGVDSTLQISAAEVNKYYNDRKDLYKQQANRDIEYVLYEVVPSREDIDAIKAEYDALYAQFAEAQNLKNFIALNSDRRWDDNFYSREELKRASPAFVDFAFGSADGVSAIDSTADAFTAVRVAERKMVPDSVSLSYAMFSAANRAQADSLLAAVMADGGSADMTEPAWVTMEGLAASGMNDLNVVFSMDAGQSRIVELGQYQMVAVVSVDKKTKAKEKVQLAYFSKHITPSEDTYREYNMKAASLADRSEGSYEKFAQIVKDESLPVIPLSRITIDTRRIGVVNNARSVVHWVFDRKTKKGSVSDVIPVDNKYYFVAAVTETRKEGQIPLEEVKDEILTALINQKKVDKVASESLSKISGGESIEVLAEKFSTTVNHRTGMSFASADMSTEPAFAGAVAAAPTGKVIGPVKGSVGVYFFEVKDSATGEYYTESDAVNRNLQNAMYMMQSISQIVSQEADVKDYRAKFY